MGREPQLTTAKWHMGETDTRHLLKKNNVHFFPKTKNPFFYLAVDFAAIFPEYND